MTKTVPQESFFNFFKTIEMPDEKDLKKEPKEENEDEEPEKDVGELMDEDFDLGNEFKDQLIPLALEYYLEVIEEDEEDDEDGGCDDEGCDDKLHHGGKKDQDSDEDEREVIFLYKLKSGPTESSFGLNVAKMAGIPDEILAMASKLADEFEKKMTT